MKRLFLFLLIFSLRCFAAPGDIKWATVETNGWVLDVCVDTIGTNGAFNFGFNTNFNTGVSKVVLAVNSKGYNDSGSPITVGRTIYGTKQLRLPYPSTQSSPTNDISASGADAVIRVALSDFVYSSCTLGSVSIGANWYSNNNAAVLTGSAITNLSVQAYPTPIANWSWPGRHVIHGNTMTLRAIGFHRSAQQGRPLRLMQFIAKDQHSHQVSANVTQMTCDRTFGDAVPVSEYVANLDISTFTEGDAIRCDFAAFPWIGDTPLATSDNVHSTGPLYAAITNICDRTNGYSAVACIDATNGVDASGVAVTPTSFAANNFPAPFKTIDAAILAIKGTNNALYGHNDAGGGVLYFTNGNYTMTASGAYGTSLAWFTFTNYPSVSQSVSNIVITSASGFLTSIPLRVCGVTITIPSGVAAWSKIEGWFDKDYINSATTGFYFVGTNAYWNLTRCTIPVLGQGIKTASGLSNGVSLVRGNNLNGLAAQVQFYTMLGNINTNIGSAGFACQPQFSSQASLSGQTNWIFANNAFYNWSALTGPILNVVDFPGYNGAMIQNVFECSTNSSQQMIWVYGDDSTNTPVNHILVWNNVGVGQRFNCCYNSDGTNAAYRYFWSVKNNLFEALCMKTDWFTGGKSGLGASGNRTGNWPFINGTGFYGNAFYYPTNVGAQFPGDFAGLNSQYIGGGSTQVVSGWAQFVNRKAFDGSANGAGVGDYRLLSSSPAQSIPKTDWLLPYDIAGNPRSSFDPPGAYVSGSYKKTAGFFQ